MMPAAYAEHAESRALTGLRGTAALLVVLHHVSLHFDAARDLPVVGTLLHKGYLGVDLFFVLSGFVMCMVYGSWFSGPGRATGARALAAVPLFLARRIARIWPLHAAVLAVLLAAAAAVGDPLPSPRFVLANLALIQGWGISGEINTPAWSVSTELFAYLLFPLLAAPVLWRRGGAALALAAVCAMLAACVWFAPPLGPARRGLLDIYLNYSALPLLRCLAGFTLGMLAWRARRAAAVRQWAGRPWVGPGALGAAAGLMLTGGNDLLILALLPVVVLGMHQGQGRVWRVFAGQPLHGLGTLSYAIYLIHYSLLAALPPDARPLLTVLALYAVTVLLLAIFAHHLIERPTRRLMRWLGDALVRSRTWPALAGLVQRAPVRES